MGLFGGSSSKSYSTTIMQDHRVTAEEAEIVAGAGAVLTMPGSMMVEIGQKAQVGDVLIQEYTPEIQKTIAQVVGTFAESTQEVTEVLGEKLIETQQGVASILPKLGLYAVVAVIVIVVVRKVWK